MVPAPTPSKFEGRLEAAQGKRDQARSRPAPRYSGEGSKDEALSFINGELTTWIKQTLPAVQDTESAYGDAFALSTNDEQRLQAHGEVAQLWAWFADEFTEAAISAMPRAIRDNKELRENFVNALLDSSKNARSAASHRAKQCMALAARSGSKSPLVATCSEILQRFPPEPKAAAPVQSKKPGAPWDRPTLPSSQPEPCVFRGSVRVRTLLYAAETGPRAIAALDGQAAVELEQLVLANRRSGRARVVLSWPLAATAWLDAAARPLALRKRTDIVPDHVWVDPGFLVNAATVRDGTAEVFAPFYQPAAKGPKPEPREFAARLACADLELAASWVSGDQIRGSWLELKPGSIELYDRPQGRPVAKLVGGDGVYAREEQDGWVPIAGGHPFGFAGWTPARNVSSKTGPMQVSFLRAIGAPSHVVTRPLPVRAKPVTTEQPIGQLAAGAPVKLGKTDGGFVEVTSRLGIGGAARSRNFVDDTSDASDLPPFYALASDVAQSTAANSD